MTFRPNIKPKKKERMGIRESAQVRSPRHRQWIRGRGCFLAGRPGHVCNGPIDCMHWHDGTDGGGADKPSDFWCFPGCRFGAHVPQHAMGEEEFERLHKIKGKDLCRQYAAASPHKRDWLDLGRDPAKEGTDIAPRRYGSPDRYLKERA